jgi:hypothetical protein
VAPSHEEVGDDLSLALDERPAPYSGNGAAHGHGVRLRSSPAVTRALRYRHRLSGTRTTLRGDGHRKHGEIPMTPVYCSRHIGRNGSTMRANRAISAAQQVRELLCVGHRLIAKAVVYTLLGAVWALC